MEVSETYFLLGCNADEVTDYFITMPSMYARGILFGKMVLELGDSCIIKNERTGMSCDVEFKTKVQEISVLAITYANCWFL